MTNFGIKADVAYSKGRHNAKAGIQINQTNLQGDFRLGVTDWKFNPVCLTYRRQPGRGSIPDRPGGLCCGGLSSKSRVGPGLVPYNLTRGGTLFHFNQGTHIKEQAAFVQDTITLGHFTFNAGLRFDHYDGLSSAAAWQPRVGIAYQVHTGTVLRVSYSRSLETPFNENLVLSSATGAGGLATNVFGAAAVPLQSGRRNQFNAGFQQAIGRKLILDGDYFWKYTHNAYVKGAIGCCAR